MTNHSSESTSATMMADLAKAGFSIARKSFMQVNFEVHHLADRCGYLASLLQEHVKPGESPSTDKTVPRETLTSAANGIGLIIATNAGALPPELQSRRQGSSLPFALQIRNEDRAVARVFSGTAWPNPTFIYESASVFEGLISIDHEAQTPSYEHGLAIRELLYEISSLAAETAKAPILVLQCPVQLPPNRFVGSDVGTNRELWPEVSSIAVRFAIALQHPTVAQRLDLGHRLSRFCSPRGYGLWLADTRVGSHTGNWVQIRSQDTQLVQASLKSMSWQDGASEVSCGFPVTFVGPARTGSTHAILGFCREFTDLGILGCSVTSLDDLAFIHLQLAINDVSPSGLQERQERIEHQIKLIGEAQKPGAKTSTAQALLPKLLSELVGRAQATYADAAMNYLKDRAGNYQVLAGPAIPIKSMDRKRKPLWFSWQSHSSDAGLAVPVIAFMNALRSLEEASNGNGAKIAVAEEPNIEYLVCRELGSVLRGKGKASLRIRSLTKGAENELESDEARLCTSLEDAWRAELEQFELPGVVELAVAWLEHRLDHPTASG